MTGERRRAAFCTLGCKVNQYETEALIALFKKRGYDIVDFTEEADVYILNTCTVTHLADRKSRQLIRRCLKTNPHARVAVTGCYAQNAPEEVARIPGVSLVAGTMERKRLADWMEELEKDSRPVTRVKDVRNAGTFEEIEADRIIERARPYLKVQEGCEQFCTYCIIPYVRGTPRSLPPENAVREAKSLIEAGFKEIILTGIHLGAYGRDLGAGASLESLLRELLELAENVRWRLSSLEPVEVTRELLRLIQEYRNFCPHLHLPLQSGHDEILRAMNRPYTTAKYREIVEMARESVPDICITTDIMAGFPGETDRHFEECLRIVEEMAFGDLHVFKYSPRRGTPAARLPRQVPPPVKEKRSRELIRLGERLAHRYASVFLGRRLEVLAETLVGDDLWEGHSANYLTVRFKSTEFRRGQIIPVEVTAVKGKICSGRVLRQET